MRVYKILDEPGDAPVTKIYINSIKIKEFLQSLKIVAKEKPMLQYPEAFI